MALNTLNYQNNTMIEDLRETFEALKKQESSYKHCDYLNEKREGVCIENRPLINKMHRFQMAQWCFEVAEFCNYNDEIVSIAMSYVDRFLSSKHVNIATHDTRSFKLATMCSLLLAMKFHNSQSPNINMDLLLQISNESYTKEEISSMKRKLLHALSFRLCSPTSHVFLDFIMNDLFASINISNNTKESILNISRKQLKLAVPNYRLSLVDPSIVAFASVFNAMEEVKVSNNVKQEFICHLNNITGFKYDIRQKKNGFIFWSVKAFLCKQLNRRIFDSIKGEDHESKAPCTVLIQENKKQECDTIRVNTSSPTCSSALVA